MNPTIETAHEYETTLARVRQLQERLSRLAHRRGIRSPEVLALSQEIDRYIVSIHRYWARLEHDERLVI